MGGWACQPCVVCQSCSGSGGHGPTAPAPNIRPALGLYHLLLRLRVRRFLLLLPALSTQCSVQLSWLSGWLSFLTALWIHSLVPGPHSESVPGLWPCTKGSSSLLLGQLRKQVPILVVLLCEASPGTQIGSVSLSYQLCSPTGICSLVRTVLF